jgi:DNA-binding NarL/FixJ family response regulator
VQAPALSKTNIRNAQVHPNSDSYADDHAIVRAGLKQFIAGEKDMVVSGEAADGMETLACVRKGECDVVLLDISMPGKNGIDTLRQLKRSRPDLPVLILSAYSEQQFAVSLLRAGASGYISKESASEQLVTAIRTVIGGGKYVSPSVAQVLSAICPGNRQAAPCRPVQARVSDLLSTRIRRKRLEDCGRAVPQRENRQYLPGANPREDADEQQRRPDLLRSQKQYHRLACDFDGMDCLPMQTGCRINADSALGA